MFRFCLILVCSIFSLHSIAQQDSLKLYQWKSVADVSLLGSAAALNTYFLLEEPNGQRFITLDEIRSVSRDDIPSYDVSATYNWNESASSWSDVVQLASMASPLLLLKSEKVRKEKWMIALMGFQTLAINQGISGALKLSTNRKRPYVYNEDAPDEIKYRRQVFYSFPSAHTSASAAATFFGATVFTQYYPDSPYKPLVWGTAITLPALTGYLRFEGGRHFPTDVLGGYVIGAIVGVLVPQIHKIGGDTIKIGAVSRNDAVGLSFSVKID